MKKDESPKVGFRSNRVTLFTLAAVTILGIGISILCLSSGYFIIFQNFFYIPIIIACVYYTRRGCAFSVIIACIYFILTVAFTRDLVIILQALVRVLIFIIVAAVITYLSLTRKKVEETLQQQHDHLEDLVLERTAQLEEDITERKQTEKVLRASEEKYRITLDSMMEGCQIINFNWRYIYLNDAAVKHSHQSREELLGRTMMEAYPGIEDTEMFANLQRCMEDRIPHRMENVFTYPDGSENWFELSMEPIPEGVFVLSIDITEKKRLEQERKKFTEALQESLQFNSSVLENSPHSILVRKPDTSITYANPALEKLTGFDSSELIGKKNVFPFWAEEQLKKYNGNLEKAVSTGIYKQERQFLNKAKEPFWVEVTTIPIRSKGQIKYFLSNWTDITERKRVEQALKASELQYRRLFEAARDGILILNADTGLIIDVNPFLVEMLGFSHKEFLGKKIWELGLLTDIVANKDAFVELQRKGFVRYEGLPLVTTAGLRLEVEFVSNVYEVDHKKIIQCNIRDITQRKRAEQAREKLDQQLQAKVAELETFSYGIAHDLRSPMVSIEGFSRLLRDDMLNHDAEKVKEDTRLLEKSVRKMQDFLNKTLEYSRSGQVIERTENVSFSEIVREVITEFAEKISASGATVSLAKTFPRVRVDRMRIKQALVNLIQNSIKYRDKTVPLKIELGYYPSGNEAVFFVRDNGIGIDASEAEKVFGLFYRGTAEGEGSGIGLAIVKKIIEAHGGRIWVQQGRAGKGTTMCFTLSPQSGIDKEDNNGNDQDTSCR